MDTVATAESRAALGATLRARLVLHSRLRWVGVALFAIAIPGVLAVVTRVVLGMSPPGHLVVCFASLLSSLSAFGTNNDTAVHAMRELGRLRALPDGFRDELRDEQTARPRALADVHASTKAGLIMPVVASLVVSWLYYRACG